VIGTAIGFDFKWGPWFHLSNGSHDAKILIGDNGGATAQFKS
jgi:hypothetical protein